MRRLCLLAPLLAAACLDIPPRVTTDAPPGGGIDAPDCDPPSDGVSVVDGQGCVVAQGSVDVTAAIQVRAPAFVIAYANGDGRVPRYPSSLVVGNSPELLFENDHRDTSPDDNPSVDCQLENGLGQALFPIGSAAFAPHDETDVGPSSFTVFAAGPVVAELSTEWTATNRCLQNGGMDSGGSTRLRYFPDGRVRRLDNLRVRTTATECPDEICGFARGAGGFITSYLALDRATFTHWSSSMQSMTPLPGGMSSLPLSTMEFGCTEGTVAAVGITSPSHAGRLNLFEDDNVGIRSIALTTDFFTNVDLNVNQSGLNVDATSTLAIAGGRTCADVAALLAVPASLNGASWLGDDGWYQTDLRGTQSATLTPFAALAPFALELLVGNNTDPAPTLGLTRSGTPLVEGQDYLRQELVGEVDRSVLLWIKAGLPMNQPLVITRS
jgi:hypothetical protein